MTEGVKDTGMGGRALVVMCKAPTPGDVKTRLVPPLSHEDAAELYKCLIEDLFDNLSGLKGVDVYAALHAPGGVLTDIVPENVPAFSQEGGLLGDRIYNALKRLKSMGYAMAAVIGSDSPDIPVSYIEEAFDALGDGRASIAIGPAEDGGYYLLAVAEPARGLFDGISWGTGRVLEETLNRAAESNVLARLIRPWRDIDTFEDLKHLKDNARTPASAAFLRRKGILAGR